MPNATCVFYLLNDSKSEMLLYLEPEGSEFVLHPGNIVQVHIFGSEHPIEMRHANDAKGQKTISFWPINGNFELFFQGKSVWERV